MRAGRTKAARPRAQQESLVRAIAQPRRKRREPELTLAKDVAAYLAFAVPTSIQWTHFPAGEKRSAMAGARLKDMGLKPGWPDFQFVLPTGKAAFIELKAKNGRLSPAQQAVRDALTETGAWWAEARSVDEVEAILASWLIPWGHKLKARVNHAR